MIKHITCITLILLVSCKSETKVDNSKPVTNELLPEETIQNNSNADFSRLFDTYTCDVSIDELAKVLQIPEYDISILTSKSADNCVFKLKGFGQGYEDTGTTLRFMVVPSSKKQSKKEIANNLKDKEELPKGVLMGRDILLADAGDCYITFQPLQGRSLILNENYNSFVVITYGSKASVQGRTKKQHDQLKIKIKDLANYLVTTHKK